MHRGKVFCGKSVTRNIAEGRHRSAAQRGAAALVVEELHRVGNTHNGVFGVRKNIRVRVLELDLFADVVLGIAISVSKTFVAALRHAARDQLGQGDLFRNAHKVQDLLAVRVTLTYGVGSDHALCLLNALQLFKLCNVVLVKSQRGRYREVVQVIFGYITVRGVQHGVLDHKEPRIKAYAQCDDGKDCQISAGVSLDLAPRCSPKGMFHMTSKTKNVRFCNFTTRSVRSEWEKDCIRNS